MNELNTYVITFSNGGLLTRVVVLARNEHIAFELLSADYREYDLEIEILEWCMVEEEGVVMTSWD